MIVVDRWRWTFARCWAQLGLLIVLVLLVLEGVR